MSAAPCAHDWQPTPGWAGRYRCRLCRAFAYKQVVMLDTYDFPVVGRSNVAGGKIVPYVCAVCGAPGTNKYRGTDAWRCNEHRNQPKPRAVKAESG